MCLPIFLLSSRFWNALFNWGNRSHVSLAQSTIHVHFMAMGIYISWCIYLLFSWKSFEIKHYYVTNLSNTARELLKHKQFCQRTFKSMNSFALKSLSVLFSSPLLVPFPWCYQLIVLKFLAHYSNSSIIRNTLKWFFLASVFITKKKRLCLQKKLAKFVLNPLERSSYYSGFLELNDLSVWHLKLLCLFV